MHTRILIVEDQFVEANHLRLMLRKAGFATTGIARSVDEARNCIRTERPELVLLDIFLAGRETGIDLAIFLREENIAFIYLSASSNEEILNKAKETQPSGFLIKPFRERDLLITMEIARYHQEHGIGSSIRKEKIFQQQLATLHDHLGGWEGRLSSITQALQPLIPFDFALAIYRLAPEAPDQVTGFLRTGFNEYRQIGLDDLRSMAKIDRRQIFELQQQTLIEDRVALYAGRQFEDLKSRPNMKQLIAGSMEMRCNLTLPVPAGIPGVNHFFFSFYSRKPNGFNMEHAGICERLQAPLAFILGKVVASDQKQAAREKPGIQVKDESVFAGIIGRSPTLLSVFDLVQQVAGSETSVLITGESGTGKERIAKSIHDLSPRKHKPYIKLNCATLPANLVESELFGHEKGAFTGATDQRIGRFELADGGTLFLDEIGEMHLDVQVKLLRVLQEKEFERIGGRAPVKVNVRIIAATNRILQKEVAEGRFRLDLYYRLNVFPLHLPSLRDRKEDICLLATHFIKLYAAKNGKDVTGLSDEAHRTLLAYDWPGNIRELENLMERSVLLSKKPLIGAIPLPASDQFRSNKQIPEWHIRTIEENERDHILSVLNKTNGRIRGTGGAAELLGVPPTTLASKIKKLGIRREFNA